MPRFGSLRRGVEKISSEKRFARKKIFTLHWAGSRLRVIPFKQGDSRLSGFMHSFPVTGFIRAVSLFPWFAVVVGD